MTWFQDHALDDELILVPGVIDSTTNFIEHPELVAHVSNASPIWSGASG